MYMSFFFRLPRKEFSEISPMRSQVAVDLYTVYDRDVDNVDIWFFVQEKFFSHDI